MRSSLSTATRLDQAVQRRFQRLSSQGTVVSALLVEVATAAAAHRNRPAAAKSAATGKNHQKVEFRRQRAYASRRLAGGRGGADTAYLIGKAVYDRTAVLSALALDPNHGLLAEDAIAIFYGMDLSIASGKAVYALVDRQLQVVKGVNEAAERVRANPGDDVSKAALRSLAGTLDLTNKELRRASTANARMNEGIEKLLAECADINAA